MRTRALDSSNDWQFGRGKQSYKTESNALQQNIKTRLKSWKGDCFFSTTDGVDWANYLDIGTKTLLDLDIKRVILQTGGVLRIVSFTSILDSDSRSVTVSASLDTIFGTITIVEEV